MKIGNGPLEFGVVGVSDNGELSIPILKELAIQTLNIYPLGEILSVTDIEIVKGNKNDLGFLPNDMLGEIRAREIKSEKNLDVVGIIRKNIFSRASYNILYSQQNHKILAHELGHILGLQHPSFSCSGPVCIRNIADRETCPYTGYIMGCELDNEGEKDFSPENIEKLEKEYLK